VSRGEVCQLSGASDEVLLLQAQNPATAGMDKAWITCFEPSLGWRGGKSCAAGLSRSYPRLARVGGVGVNSQKRIAQVIHIKGLIISRLSLCGVMI
jgi:hypothetical protein